MLHWLVYGLDFVLVSSPRHIKLKKKEFIEASQLISRSK